MQGTRQPVDAESYRPGFRGDGPMAEYLHIAAHNLPPNLSVLSLSRMALTNRDMNGSDTGEEKRKRMRIKFYVSSRTLPNDRSSSVL